MKGSKSRSFVEKRMRVLAGRKATVAVSRNGCLVQLDGVPADQAVQMVTALLDQFRAVAKEYPETIPDLIPIQAGQATWVHESDFEGRLGFKA